MKNVDMKRCYLEGKELYLSVVGKGAHDVRAVVEQLLIELGFKNKLIGTGYLRDAVLYRYAKRDAARVCYATDVYPAIAEKRNSTPERVEHAIRTAITDCSQFGNLPAFERLTHSRVSEPGYAPSNTELVSDIVAWLVLERDKGHIADPSRPHEWEI